MRTEQSEIGVLVKRFGMLGDTARAAVLCRLGHGLTVLARAYADPKAERTKLAEINELLHRLLPAIDPLRRASPDGWNELELLTAMNESAEGRGFGNAFRKALSTALASVVERSGTSRSKDVAAAGVK